MRKCNQPTITTDCNKKTERTQLYIIRWRTNQKHKQTNKQKKKKKQSAVVWKVLWVFLSKNFCKKKKRNNHAKSRIFSLYSSVPLSRTLSFTHKNFNTFRTTPKTKKKRIASENPFILENEQKTFFFFVFGKNLLLRSKYYGNTNNQQQQ